MALIYVQVNNNHWYTIPTKYLFKIYQLQSMDPKYNALFTSVNLLLGVGPLILPHSFF